MKRSSWIIQVDPKFHNKYLWETHREGDVTVEVEMGLMQTQAKACQEPQEAGEPRKDSSWSLRGTVALPTP